MPKLFYFFSSLLLGSIVTISQPAADVVPSETTVNPTTPALLSVEPSNVVIPANTLRFYLTFSNSMARGQVKQHIWIEDALGNTVENPFLQLGIELWDSQQKRLTLLIDPGRIKTGVGPNMLIGAVFREGHQYAIVVSKAMLDINSMPIGIDQRIEFVTGPAIVDPVELSSWKIDLPAAGSRSPLIVRFDRIMDVGTSRRMIAIHDTHGKPLNGKFESHSTYMEFFPSLEWVEGVYRLKVDVEIEDVAGNSIVAPFETNRTDEDLDILSELSFKIIGGNEQTQPPTL